jgi:hypothetical protein
VILLEQTELQILVVALVEVDFQVVVVEVELAVPAS